MIGQEEIAEGEEEEVIGIEEETEQIEEGKEEIEEGKEEKEGEEDVARIGAKEEEIVIMKMGIRRKCMLTKILGKCQTISKSASNRLFSKNNVLLILI